MNEDMQKLFSEKMLLKNGIEKSDVKELLEYSKDDFSKNINTLYKIASKKLDNLETEHNNIDRKKQSLDDNMRNFIVYDFIINSEKKASEQNISLTKHLDLSKELCSRVLNKIEKKILIAILLMITTILSSIALVYTSSYGVHISIAAKVIIAIIFFTLYLPNQIMYGRMKASQNMVENAIKKLEDDKY